ncbi:type I restriction enzyme, S subunit [Anaerovibrio lipolyticus DSM 3074]|uniref:Type I restriction modification DNA specificity domain-containing protein n=2 Tax=Anaerovibrio lipolyticus TaxID=82374 RepID=A0A0B2K0V5_9FIRM|nr:restriction endonuclease subunit S [Anaerovibrio lipolyticus]KHM52466.1 hypothetical protein NZ47_04640 [Anaerovibrio lipolyticus]SHI64619.1 type I restriction enzyme, S subunit [Anaerovibrio lipolyticus DSM 3074]
MSNTISSLSEVIDSLHATPKYQDDGYSMVRVVDVENDFLSLEGCFKVDKETYLNHNKKHHPVRGDIIITRVGSYGMVGYVDIDDKFCLGQNLSIIHPENIFDGKFLYYYILSPFMQKVIYGNIGGSAYKSLGLEEIRKLPLKIEGLNRKRIGEFLYIIDKKIHTNKKIISTLESMAKTLYDYWFVQFDFPDANGRPYKTSGGKMIWNEELGREIPEGWQILSLKELASYSTERISSSEMTRQNYVGMDNMIANRCGIKESEYDPPEGDMIRFKANYILLGNIRPYFKKIWLAGYNGGCSPDVLAIMPNEDSISEFVYTTLSQDTFFDYDTAGAKGTKMPRGDKDHIMSYPIPWNKKLAIIFGERLRAGYKMRNKLMIENKSLTKLRDFLLPMLMNGQVGFKET